MDINKSGGPAFSTLSGGLLEENVFRFEGMSLFDYFAAQVLAAGGSPEEAFADSVKMVELRTKYFNETPDERDPS